MQCFAFGAVSLGEQLKHFTLYPISFILCTFLVKRASNELILYFTICQPGSLLASKTLHYVLFFPFRL